jgi:hypothetical protein
LKLVHATHGKHARAEPVAGLYENGRVHHAGNFAALEDQMTQWSPLESTYSPDRLDALVYALTELVIDNPIVPYQSRRKKEPEPHIPFWNGPRGYRWNGAGGYGARSSGRSWWDESPGISRRRNW